MGGGRRSGRGSSPLDALERWTLPMPSSSEIVACEPFQRGRRKMLDPASEGGLGPSVSWKRGRPDPLATGGRGVNASIVLARPGGVVGTGSRLVELRREPSESVRARPVGISPFVVGSSRLSPYE